MLSTEKQRPKTCISDKTKHNNLRIRPKTSSVKTKPIHSSQRKDAAKNNSNADAVQNKEYSAGKVCFSACTQRPQLVSKETRPYTAPESHQIPFDLDQLTPLFDESEYLYLHVPDEGTDSEGEHYINHRRPKMDIKSSRRKLNSLIERFWSIFVLSFKVEWKKCKNS